MTGYSTRYPCWFWCMGRLPVRTLDFQGVQNEQSRQSWQLDAFVDEVLPHYDNSTILIGHDLGGVVGAMSAVKQPPKAVVLTGTALGKWWFWTRQVQLPFSIVSFTIPSRAIYLSDSEVVKHRSTICQSAPIFMTHLK